MKKIRFIINPISGGFSKKNIPDIIRSEIDSTKFQVEIFVSKNANETEKYAKPETKDIDAIVAVGGDGTINLIAKHLVNTPTPLGIIPMGSGNGLARHLGIPMNIKDSIRIINDFYSEKIDTGMINALPFFNIAGLGFDAHIAKKFAHSVKRGLSNYAKLTIGEFNKYDSEVYEITSDNHHYKTAAFVIAVCLGSQYGNNAHISPQADLKDGRFSITILKKVSLKNVVGIAGKLFRKKLQNSKNILMFEDKSIRIYRSGSNPANIDGEPIDMPADIEFRINPLSLSVIKPRA